MIKKYWAYIVLVKSLLLVFSFFIGFENFTKAPHAIVEFSGKVIAIKDGDTFDVLYNKKTYTIRLEHIDCPEKGQPFSNKSKQKLAELCFNKWVNIKFKKLDRNKRMISEVWYNNININKQMIKIGMAWHYKIFSRDNEYAKLEENARVEKIGLWADKNPIAPWVWRKTMRKHHQSN